MADDVHVVFLLMANHVRPIYLFNVKFYIGLREF